MGGLLLVIAGHHIVPCLLVCLAIAVVLVLLFGPARIRRPRDRVLFLYVALWKGALALWVGSGLSCLTGYPRLFGVFGIRWPNVAPDSGALLEAPTLVTDLTGSAFSGRVGLLVVILAGLLLVWRWARLAPFLQRITAVSPGSPESTLVPAHLLEGLLARCEWRSRWRQRPKVVVVAPGSLPVLTVGVRSPVIVVPADLAGALGRRELEALLAHELAHIRRLDYGGRWIAAMLRDVMVWNPFAHIWTAQLAREQERAADEWVSELLGDPPAMASALVEAAAHAQRLPVLSLGPVGAWGRVRARRELETRVDALVQGSPPQAAGQRWLHLVRWAVLALFFAAQPHLAVSFPRLWRLLVQSG
jgi:Zn-dependent protease with chaperone function